MDGLVSYSSDESEKEPNSSTTEHKSNDVAGNNDRKLAAEWEAFESLISEPAPALPTSIPAPSVESKSTEGNDEVKIKTSGGKSKGDSDSESEEESSSDNNSSDSESESEEGSDDESSSENSSEESESSSEDEKPKHKKKAVKRKLSKDKSPVPHKKSRSRSPKKQVVAGRISTERRSSSTHCRQSSSPRRRHSSSPHRHHSSSPHHRHSSTRRRSRSRQRKRSRDRRRRRSEEKRRSRERHVRRRRRSRSTSRHRRRRSGGRSYRRSRSRQRHRSRDRSRRQRGTRNRHRRLNEAKKRTRSRSPKKLTFKEQLKQQLLKVQRSADGKINIEPPGEGGKVTPQQALLQTMAAMHQKAQELTGVVVPKFYNPAAVNPLKYAEQVNKRKLLWSHKKEGEESGPSTSDTTVTAATSAANSKTAAVWKATSFGQTNVDEKFRKLMGIKEDDSESGTTVEEIGEEQRKKQEELFSHLDREYAMARITTHTHRGIGLGFQSHGMPP